MREPAERPCSAAARPCLAGAIDHLSWLAPSATSLAALARQPNAATWSTIRHDPGAVLLVLRCAGDKAFGSIPALCHDGAILELAAQHLDRPAFVDWSSAPAAAIYRFALRSAGWATHLASKTTRADPEAAWVCGLLAPLGWLALCALDGNALTACLQDPAHAVDPAGTERRWCGLDHAGIARRLARRWHLPAWLALGRLSLPPAVAGSLGADPELFHLSRLAVSLAREGGPKLEAGADSTVAESAAVLGLDTAALAPDHWVERAEDLFEDPQSQPLLRDLLIASAENRRWRKAARNPDLEAEADVLQRTIEAQAQSEASRLQEGKLAALAEFAAGAGHEINNPLAVILGQAQYLLSHEEDWFSPGAEGRPKQALQKIVGQTRRVHNLLRDLMQFARPSPPAPEWFDLPALLGEAAAAQADAASSRQVQVAVEASPDRLAVYADALQVRIALVALLKNAVEAATVGGWVRLVLDAPRAGDDIEVVVEDSGPGPEAATRSNLFDPFFSGRAAGRGHGLGLPIAWRLARQQGGDVRLEPARAGAPTRFVLSLPHGGTSGVAQTAAAAFPAATSGTVHTNGCHIA